MTADTVLRVLDVLAAAEVPCWIDGGWGVDALLGRQTREHGDLDLVIALAHVECVRATLGAHGFALTADELPVRVVLAHATLGRIDLHAVTFDEQGDGVQPQPGGGTFRYPADGFTTGRIAGRPVGCISAAIQLLCHLGYEPLQKDVDDMLALHRAFGLPLRGRYRRHAAET